jgi:hypothetical protein
MTFTTPIAERLTGCYVNLSWAKQHASQDQTPE